jgi:hypothetical protein
MAGWEVSSSFYLISDDLQKYEHLEECEYLLDFVEVCMSLHFAAVANKETN